MQSLILLEFQIMSDKYIYKTDVCISVGSWKVCHLLPFTSDWGYVKALQKDITLFLSLLFFLSRIQEPPPFLDLSSHAYGFDKQFFFVVSS